VKQLTSTTSFSVGQFVVSLKSLACQYKHVVIIIKHTIHTHTCTDLIFTWSIILLLLSVLLGKTPYSVVSYPAVVFMVLTFTTYSVSKWVKLHHLQLPPILSRRWD